MRNQVFKKLFSVLLALIMVAGLLPASAMAGGWGAMDVDTTPELTGTEQPAEPTPGQGEPVAEPTPEQGEPTAEPVPTQGEPTAEPTDEGIMPANVMPVQANVAARDTSGDDYYRIVHLDCGRKYFDVNYIKGIIDTMYLNGYNQLQLAFGNGGLRFVLDDMDKEIPGITNAIAEGNENFYPNSGQKSVLTESEMTEIIQYANGKKIEIVPLLNMPGHMDGILSTSTYSKYRLKGTVNGEERYDGSLDLNNTDAVDFGKKLLAMYVEYFADKGCKFFNFGADEYGQNIQNPYIGTSVANVTYNRLINYMNACVAIIESAGMTARCFNDFVCYNHATTCDLKKSVQVCYWSNQWPNSQYNTVNAINNAGYNLINTNQKWYFVPSKAEEYSKATVLANFKTFDVTKFQHITSGYNSSSTTYYEISGGNNVGAMFCVWCDKPAVAVDLSDVKELIAAMADANPTYFTKVTIPNTTVSNATTADNATVRVTGPNLAALTATEYTEEIAGIKAVDGRIKAYNVTPSTADNNKYTGEAEVRIKIPAEWDSSKVIAFIVESDGTVEDINGTATEDGWYVFTAPHFSVMGIYEQAVTYVEKTVTVAVGDSETVTIEGYDYSEQVGEIDTNIATVKVTYEGVTVSEFTPATSISNNAKYIVKYGDKYIDENGKLTDNISEAAEWTYERYNTYGKLKNSKDQYLTYQSNGSFTTVQGYNNNSWLYVNGTTVNMHDGSGYNIALSLGTKTEGSSQPSTIITFTGVKEGTTSVVIGGTRYTVKVVDKTLTDNYIYVNYFITNQRVTGSDGVQSKKVLAAEVNTEEGKALSEIAAQTGIYTSGNVSKDVKYYKSELQLAENIQTHEGWTNKIGKGTVVEKIRYWENKWSVYNGKEWVNIDTTIYSTTTDPETYAGKEAAVSTYIAAITAYYLLKTDVTQEIITYATDWGEDLTDGDDFSEYSLLDFAVVYKSDNKRSPDSFANSKTLVYNNNAQKDYKWNNGENYARYIKDIYAENTSNYEVYMITVTENSGQFAYSSSQSISSTTIITYPAANEKVAWALSEDDFARSGLEKYTDYNEGGDPIVSQIYAKYRRAYLVTYYVRLKETVESKLTVNYYVEGASDPFYTYHIGVYNTTTFNTGFARTESPTGLINNTVVNSLDVIETVQWELEKMPEIGAQYRYSDYKFTNVILDTTDYKTVNLYYTFSSTKTFVVDYGLPLVIQPKDINTNLGNNNVNITNVIITRKSTYASITTDNNHYITYTLTEMISGNDTFSVKYEGTLNTGEGSQGGETGEYTVTIIPATNVYYEDSFAKFYGSDGNEQTGFSKTNEVPDQKPGVWYIDGQEKTANQALEVLGTKENVYGYDPAYQDSTMFSMGSARKVTVTSDMAKDGVVWPTAQFTFKGTGFDIISLTNNTSGAIFVDVYKGKEATGNRFKSYMVDNYYGYKYENGAWVVDKNASNALYQIPVMRMRDLGYGEYTAVVTVFYDRAFDHADRKTYNFWLDAVRVYDPMGESVNTGETYKPDGEAYPQYIKLRSELKKLNSDGTASSGALFIDGKENANISEYANYGPNNEVYLAKGQAITFKLTGNLDKIAAVQIGAKAPMSGDIAKLSVVNGTGVVEKELSTATEMYYDITTAAVNNGNAQLVTVTNTGDAILSLTNLKITYTEGKQTVSLGEVRAEQQTQAVQMIRALFAPAPVEPEPEPEPEKTFEPERFEASWSRNVMQGRKATLTVKTSEDVEAITVDGQTIRSYRTRTERVGFGRRAKRITYREFTYSMVAQESADFSVTAINAEGTESEAITARLTVKTRPNSLRDMWDWFKGWF